jgi:hypothetical protein
MATCCNLAVSGAERGGKILNRVSAEQAGRPTRWTIGSVVRSNFFALRPPFLVTLTWLLPPESSSLRVVRARQGVRMLRALNPLPPLQNLHLERLGFVRFPLPRVCRCKVDHAHQGVRMLKAQRPLAHLQHLHLQDLPWSEYVDARLLMLVKVSGCRRPT